MYLYNNNNNHHHLYTYDFNLFHFQNSLLNADGMKKNGNLLYN